MANMLGSAAWGRWGRKCKRVGRRLVPRRTKSAQRHAEKRQWVTKDQEMPYYWHPTADIEEDYEDDPSQGPAGWAWRILQGDEGDDG